MLGGLTEESDVEIYVVAETFLTMNLNAVFYHLSFPNENVRALGYHPRQVYGIF